MGWVGLAIGVALSFLLWALLDDEREPPPRTYSVVDPASDHYDPDVHSFKVDD